jgi:hypothetical protein
MIALLLCRLTLLVADNPRHRAMRWAEGAAKRRGASLPSKRAHFFASVSQPLYVLFHVVPQFILIAADRDTTGLVLRLRISDYVTDALARMNGDASVAKLSGSDRRAC